jgi:transposase
MSRKAKLRQLSETERAELERLSRSRTASAREVERAKIILWFAQGQQPATIAEQLGRCLATVYNQIRRFNEKGLTGFEDDPRSGRPLVYDEMVRGQLVGLAKTHPEQLGLAFGQWSLERLTEYAHEHLGIAISRSQLGEILMAEGLKWYQEKTYFTERPDPQFAEKRGQL